MSTANLLTADELGKILHCTGATIRRWHRDGVIPSEINHGHVLRFDEAEVRKALRKQARERDKVRSSDLTKLMVPTT